MDRWPGMTPQAIARLTPAQQLMLLDPSDSVDHRTGRPVMTFRDAREALAFLAKLKAK